MCGIAALIGKASIPEFEGQLRAMLEIAKHRGPDSNGTFTDDGIGLGHLRLSIVDLSSAGHQPMAWKSRYWITYNGEVYNYLELRTELEVLGQHFQSGTDTEVILAAYEVWGEKCLERFNGMFAFVIWDSIEKKIFAARDRFGVKPLYYWQSPSGFLAFASEIKQFTVLPEWKARLNGQLAYEYLNWSLTDHTNGTLFKDVFHLPPGHFLETSSTSSVTSIQEKIHRWYDLKPSKIPSGTSLPARFIELLKDSVRLRLRSDVAVGSCLSGGLDSTSVVAIMNGLLKESKSEEKQRTFSAVFPGDPIDESRAIAETVNLLGVENRQVLPTAENFSKKFESLIWHQDEPFVSTSLFAQWEVFRIAKESGVTVMVDGQGADEALAGYHIFFGPHLLGIFKEKGCAALIREIGFLHELHGYSKTLLFLKMLNHALPNWLRHLGRKLTGKTTAISSWLNIKNFGATPRDPWRIENRPLHSTSDLSWALLTSLNLQMLLRYEDRNSMAHSIEARVPFLDYRFVEYALALPDDMKIQDGVTKGILRDTMKGAIPESIRTNTKKIGFETPESRWFEKPNTTLRADLEMALKSAQPYLSPSIANEFKTYLAGQGVFNSRLFRIYCFEKWRTLFSVAH